MQQKMIRNQSQMWNPKIGPENIYKESTAVGRIGETKPNLSR